MAVEEKRIEEIKRLKPGSFVLLDDEVYRVDKVQISKPGKHGGAKARLDARGVFSVAKKSVVKPADDRLKVPIIEKKVAQVVAITGDTAQLMDLEDYSTSEVAIPEELKGQLEPGIEVLIWRFGNKILIKGKK